jgi:hypothetical protein
MRKSIIVLLILFKISCKYENPRGLHLRKFVDVKYNSSGNILYRKEYSSDSLSNGEEVHFHANGNIKKWYWYNLGQKYPVCAIYYDNIKSNEKIIGGQPILKITKDVTSWLRIELINPPGIYQMVGVREFSDNKLQWQKAYYPKCSDSTCWVNVGDFKFYKDRNYFVYYYILNNQNKIIDSFSAEMLLDVKSGSQDLPNSIGVKTTDR